MVAWWKRLLFSLVSMVVASVACLCGILLVSAAKSHKVNFHSSEVLLTIAVLIGFCLIGWVFSVPAVLMCTNIRAWRFWLYWALGSCIGPLLMLVLCAAVFFAMPHDANAPWFSPVVRPLIYMAAAISSLTSLLYLALLRWAQVKAKRPIQDQLPPTGEPS
jgi:MFS family permease